MEHKIESQRARFYFFLKLDGRSRQLLLLRRSVDLQVLCSFLFELLHLTLGEGLTRGVMRRHSLVVPLAVLGGLEQLLRGDFGQTQLLSSLGVEPDLS